MKLYNLFHKKVFQIQPGLEKIKKALAELGNPEKKFRSVLISGTNGKGSTASFFESLLRHHRYKTGLFTSPHLVKENERWQINRKNISDEKLNYYINQIKPVIEKYQLTYFEASTIIAFKYFSDENVDFAVLEVGLGGRWDATNVVYPELSVITNVSLDHTHLLGNTIESIAFEKLGISRIDRPLILGSSQFELIYLAKMRGIQQIIYPPDKYSFKGYVDRDFTTIDYRYRNIELNSIKSKILGKRQIQNIATALTAFLVLSEKENIPYNEEKIKEAVFSNRWSGRMEVIKKKPLVIIDGAHNKDAVTQTLQELKEIYPEKKIITIYGGMKDKEWQDIIRIIENFSERIYFTEMPFDRSINRQIFNRYFSYKVFSSPGEALKEVENTVDNSSLILVTGSLYLIGEIKKEVENGRNTVSR
ncbi:bifunctional folylpolyglutamate synthase/dihydrofolate synthase [Persephonella sp.]